MHKIRIPNQHRAGIKLIASLSSDAVEALRRALEDHPTLDSADVSKHFEANGASLKDRRQIVEALLPLYLLKEDFNSSAEEMADTVSEAMSAHWEADVLPHVESKLAANLRSLLDLQEVGLRARVRGLMVSDERTFCDVRIVTDLRPAFGRNAELGPLGVGIVHLLTLGYHSRGSSHLEFQISLSTSDLKNIRDAVERAQRKTESLKATLKKAGIRHLGDNDDA